jgi:hypothetical protein
MPLPDLNLLLALDVLLDEGSVVPERPGMNLSAPAMSRTLGGSATRWATRCWYAPAAAWRRRRARWNCASRYAM